MSDNTYGSIVLFVLSLGNFFYFCNLKKIKNIYIWFCWFEGRDFR